MNRTLIICLAASASLFANTIFAASGQLWEITTKTDMPSISVPMGGTTVTSCIQKGLEKDPKQFMQQEGDCKVTDLKTAGNKSSWKMRCDKDGEVMSGGGEVNYKPDSLQGVTRLSGKSDGRNVNMTAEFRGKRIGSPCDTSAPPAIAITGMENINEMMGMANKQIASAMAEQCEISNYKPAELISNRFFGPTSACPGKEKFACKVIGKNVYKDANIYIKFITHDYTSDTSIAKACAIDMAATTKAICKTVDAGNYQELAEYCPTEAKTFETERSGTSGSANVLNPPDNAVIDGAKKLKGLFGF